MNTRASEARRSPLLPAQPAPAIVHARGRNADNLDVLLAIVPPGATGALERLPQPARWRELHARTPARTGTVRSGTLGNARQTTAVLGYLRKEASPFERLTLAARMLKEAAGREPQTVGLAATEDGRAAQATLEALLAATLVHAFALPTWRAPARGERRVRRVEILNAAGFDPKYEASVAAGTNLARWLTALPPNILDARGYRRAITELARTHHLKLRWLDERQLKRLGANAFLAVAAANDEPGAGIAHLSYRPHSRSGAPDVALIGKGIIFDTGGVNVKSHRSMLDMHTDMAGSAVALASLVTLAELKAPIAADAWLAITENRVGPHGYKPQDVIRAANGVTIQVIHSDAEGRMALADTLALAARTRPRFMIDFATLTGACVYALTERMSGVFTNRDALVPKLVAAGSASGERVWNFPFAEDYDQDLESKVADIVQCAVEGKGDHIHATRFLSRFVPAEIPWAHVDLSSATRHGGLAHVGTEVTGFGVRFALELLLRQGLTGALEKSG
ncbi:MAG: leucyl aminopeptidase family protein [Proteobacteria bacterium]|nr:leucyl aminopeptidase family protein [Pseudomonadota bacterium]